MQTKKISLNISRYVIQSAIAGTLFFSTAFAFRSGGGEPASVYSEKAQNLLVKSESIHDYFSIDEDGVSLFDGPENKINDVPEFVLYWDEISVFVEMVRRLPVDEALKIYQAKKDSRFGKEYMDEFRPMVRSHTEKSDSLPLKGYKIALDPGHVGGDMEFAELERKFIKIRKDPDHGRFEEISFNEGNLALGTALILKAKLEAAGAEVLLTREKEGHTAFGITFDEWLQNEIDSCEMSGKKLPFAKGNGEEYALKCAAYHYTQTTEDMTESSKKWWLEQAEKKHIYRIPFLKSEFKERAAKINAFRPDITLIIHYNVHEINEPEASGFREAVHDNFCMAFVPGSFMDKELERPEDRLAFTYKLVSDDIEKSTRLSSYIMDEHEKILEIPVIGFDSTLKYLKNASLMTEEKGVFSRNLSLTRLVNGVMCFGESLYQDNVNECILLNDKSLQIEGMQSPLPQRIEKVADAYYNGLMRYFNQQ